MSATHQEKFEAKDGQGNTTLRVVTEWEIKANDESSYRKRVSEPRRYVDISAKYSIKDSMFHVQFAYQFANGNKQTKRQSYDVSHPRDLDDILTSSLGLTIVIKTAHQGHYKTVVDDDLKNSLDEIAQSVQSHLPTTPARDNVDASDLPLRKMGWSMLKERAKERHKEPTKDHGVSSNPSQRAERAVKRPTRKQKRAPGEEITRKRKTTDSKKSRATRSDSARGRKTFAFRQQGTHFVFDLYELYKHCNKCQREGKQVTNPKNNRPLGKKTIDRVIEQGKQLVGQSASKNK
jgi:hypothetical protein